MNGLIRALANRLARLGSSIAKSDSVLTNQVANLERGVVARFDAMNGALDARLTNLESGVVVRFDGLNGRLDTLSGQSGQLLDLVRGSGHVDLAEDIDRLDAYLVYHVSELSRSIARLEERESRLEKASAALQQSLARSDEALGRVETRLNRQIIYTSNQIDAVLTLLGFDVVVPGDEPGLVSYLARHGGEGIEPGVRAAIKALLPNGGTAIDVGSNIGLHTLTMAYATGKTGKVYSFEPNVKIAAAQLKTLQLNGLAPQTTVVRSAASDRNGRTTFYQNSHSPESSLFPLAGADTIEIETQRLDDVIAPGTRVDLVKIDVEGAEPLVLAGMTRILDENPDIRLIMEWSQSHFKRAGHDATAFFADLTRRGFRAELIDDGQPGVFVELTQPIELLESTNLLFSRVSIQQRTPQQA